MMLLMEVAAGGNSLDFSPLLNALKGSITPAELIAVIAAVVGIGMGFFLAWLGIRKAITAFQSAVSKGKLKA